MRDCNYLVLGPVSDDTGWIYLIEQHIVAAYG